VWLNPQIVLISATIATKIHPTSSESTEMIHMNPYVIIAIGNKSIQDSRHLDTLVPECIFCIANHYNMLSEKDALDPSIHDLLTYNAIGTMENKPVHARKSYYLSVLLYGLSYSSWHLSKKERGFPAPGAGVWGL